MQLKPAPFLLTFFRGSLMNPEFQKSDFTEPYYIVHIIQTISYGPYHIFITIWRILQKWFRYRRGKSRSIDNWISKTCLVFVGLQFGGFIYPPWKFVSLMLYSLNEKRLFGHKLTEIGLDHELLSNILTV